MEEIERPGMRDRMTPWMRHAADLLRDGEWREREWVMREMGKAIPPGVAVRFQEQVRLARRGQQLKNGRPTLRSTDERIVQRESTTLVTMGRRAIALKALHTARRVEQEKREDGKIYVRLRPTYGRNQAPPELRQKRRTGESNSVGPEPEPR